MILLSIQVCFVYISDKRLTSQIHNLWCQRFIRENGRSSFLRWGRLNVIYKDRKITFHSASDAMRPVTIERKRSHYKWPKLFVWIAHKRFERVNYATLSTTKSALRSDVSRRSRVVIKLLIGSLFTCRFHVHVQSANLRLSHIAFTNILTETQAQTRR